MVDTELLGAWVNPTYLNSAVLTQMRDRFDGTLRLGNFLVKEKADAVRDALLKGTRTRQWRPDLHSYHAPAASGILEEFRSFVRSETFAALLCFITGEKHLSDDADYRIFAHRDYILLNDRVKPRACLDALFCFAREWDASWGGSLEFAGGGHQIEGASPQHNTLTLVLRPKGAQPIFSYVNHRAKKAAFGVLHATFQQNRR